MPKTALSHDVRPRYSGSMRSTLLADAAHLTRLPWVLAVVASLACGGDPQSGYGGDTHWLSACATEDDCDRGTCIWGVCTQPCDGDAQCAGARPAACYASDSPGLARLPGYAGVPAMSGKGICLADCEDDGHCGSHQRCHLGACLTEAVPTDPDAGLSSAAQEPSTDGAVKPGSGAPASAFSHLEVEVSFDTPVVVPTPERVFSGTDADRLVGHWHDTRCLQTTDLGYCMWLEITRDEAEGGVTGRLRWEAVGIRPPEEFEQATDPDVGHPEGVTPLSLGQYMTDIMPGVRSPMLDPRLEEAELHFWASPMHLWDEWCRLQTSYRVPGGSPSYQCVDPDSPDDEVDEAKRVLCTSRHSGGTCESREYGPLPCNCLDESGLLSTTPLCSPAVCRCDARECVPDYHAARRAYVLSLRGDALVRDEPGADQAQVFEREAAP